MKKFRLLDLCCGAGGASMGYHQAGFEVVGVDIVPQPNYPFKFHQGDALTFDLAGYDAVHVSPPCQGYSQASYFHKGTREKHPLLIAPFRSLLQSSGLPYVIENVVDRAKPHMHNPIVLCGAMFGLRTYRHRLFESNVPLYPPHHPPHVAPVANPGAIPGANQFWSIGGHFGKKHEAALAMGITWMKTIREIANAIPPAYTEYIGLQLISHLTHIQPSTHTDARMTTM